MTPAILPLGSTTAASGTITWPVGIALNVRALDTISSTFQWSTTAGTQFTGTSNPNNTRFAWDFGDTVDGGDTDKLVGFNAAHVYDTASTDGVPSTYYTLKLTTTDNTGAVATASVLVDVTSGAIAATANGGAGVDGIAVPDGMPASTPDVPVGYTGTRILYVNSSTGNNSYSGTSETVSGTSGPLQTYGGALAKLQTAPFNDGGAVQIRFMRGQTFNVYGTDYSSVANGVNLKNVLIGAYGSTSIADPKLNLADTGLNAYGMIDLGESSQNVTIQDLEFTSTISDASDGYSAAVYVRGQNITLRNSTLGNAGHTDGNFYSEIYVQTNVTGQTLDGFLLDNTSDNGNWVSGYVVQMFGQFADVAITGNSFTGGSLNNHQPFFRIDPEGPAAAGGLDDGRILVSGNTIEPTAYNGAVFTLRDDQLSGDPVVVGYYVYVTGNTFNGPVSVGQGTSSPTQTDYAWTVFDGNRVNSTDGTSFLFNQDEYQLTYENNVVEKFAAGTAAAFAESVGLSSVATAPAIYGTSYLTLANNTVYAASSNSIAYSPQLTQLAQTYTVTSTGQTLPAVTHVTIVDNLVVNPLAYATTHYGPNLILYSASQLAADFGNVFVNPSGSTTGSDSRNTGSTPVVNGESAIIEVGGVTESVDAWNAGGRASVGGAYAGFAYDDLSRTVTIGNDSSGTSFAGTYGVTSGNGEVGTTYPGNYYDYYGNIRPTGSATTVGAVQTALTPTGVTAAAASSTSITVSWSAAAGASSYIVLRSANGSSGWTQVGTATGLTFTDTGLTAGTTYYYQVESTNPAGTSAASSTASTTTATSGSGTWTDQDIGSPGYAGSASTNPAAGTITLIGGGDVSGTADAFNFDSQPLAGNGTVVAQVTSESLSSGGGTISSYAKAGVMIRESTATNAPLVAAVLSPGHGVMFLVRSTAGGSVSILSQTAASANVWVRVQRSGNLFVGSISTDGTTWTTVGSTTVTMNTNAYGGLCAAAANNAQAITGVFASAAVTPATPLVLNSQVTNDVIYLGADADGINLDVWQNVPITSTPTRVLLPSTGPVTINAGSNNEAVIVLFTGTRSPLTASGLTFNGGAGADGLQVNGGSGTHTVSATSSALTYDGVPLNFTSLASVGLLAGTGNDAVTVSSGTLTITPGSSTTAPNPVTFSSVSISSGARLLVANNSAHAGRTVVVASSLSDSGRLDLGGNDLIVRSGSLSAITALAATGYASGAWNGLGLASYSAAGDSSHLTALGVVQASSAANTSTFDGVSISSSDVLVKYTYYGDTNLDGTVNSTDTAKYNAGLASGGSLTGWTNGDFNYDGVINSADGTLISNASAGQGAAL